jgi:hypothetical protein
MKANGWSNVAGDVLPYVVRIEAPDGYGSGFYIGKTIHDGQPCAAIATMAHVVDYAFKWLSPLRIRSQDASTALVAEQFHIAINSDLDLALVEIPRDALKFPTDTLPMADSSALIEPGSSVAWCGYPNIADSTCCFFAGHISATLAEHGDYLVDGVVIHGLSGAPAFIYDGKRPVIVGVMAQYVPNRASGETLPGLGSVRNAAHLWSFLTPAKKAPRKKLRRR